MKIPQSGFPRDMLLDQVFMVDEDMLQKIVAAAGIRKNDTVLEIGAGTGNLTRLLSANSKKVIAIEADTRLKPVLKSVLGKSRNVEIIWGNALEILGKKGLHYDIIVSNPPYSISEPLIRLLFRERFRAAILTLPWKFVERLTANPEESLYSKLTIFSNAFFSIETLLRVPSSAWSPRPDTESAVIRVSRKAKPVGADSVVRQLALQDDKKLKNALREIIIKSGRSTKRNAKKKMEASGFPRTLMEKKVSEMSMKEIMQVLEIIRKSLP